MEATAMMLGRRACMITGAAAADGGCGRRCGLGGGDADPLSRAQHQGARPALSAICAGQRGDRAPRRRLPLYRGAGVVRRWPLPPVERHPERPDPEMGGGNRRDQRVSPPLALRQRQHPRPPGPPDHVRDGCATADPHRIRRHDHGARRPLRGEAPDRPQRRRRQIGRVDLVQRQRRRHPRQLPRA